MTGIGYQIRLNIKRIVFRNLRFLAFSVAMPVGFYLLFTQLMTQGMSASFLKSFNVDYLISMIVYSSLISSIFTVSNTLLDDQEHNMGLFIELSPITKIQYYISMSIVFLLLNCVSTLALEIVAILINHISVNIVYLLLLLILVPIFSSPLLILGIMVSLIGSANVIGLVSNLVVFPMAILSGLWWPMEMMPKWMQLVGKFLPTYQIAEFFRKMIQHNQFSINNILAVIAWIVIMIALLKLTLVVNSKKELQTI